MPHTTPLRTTVRAAGLALLPLLIAACGDRAQPELAGPLDAAYRHLPDSPLAVDEGCNAAKALALALDGWLHAVEAAGLQSRFSAETAEARQRADGMRTRCPDAMAAMESAAAGAQDRRAAGKSAERTSSEDPRPTLTPQMLDAYVRGMEEEIALMRASSNHFIPLSKYSAEGLQVAERAGLALSEYRGLRQAVSDVMYAHLMHERYGGADGQARLARLEPYKREHAVEMLASEPFAALSSIERDAVLARLGTLRPLYDRYMEIAAIAD